MLVTGGKAARAAPCIILKWLKKGKIYRNTGLLRLDSVNLYKINQNNSREVGWATWDFLCRKLANLLEYIIFREKFKHFAMENNIIDHEHFLFAKKCIIKDIQRELDLSATSRGGGNFLCALGLLCYTEFAGDLKTKSRGTKSERFNSFFRSLGPNYCDLIDRGINVYGDLRCGIAHTYFTKKKCAIYMPAFETKTGLFIDEKGGYHFCIGKYFEDFKIALEKLEKEIYG